MSTDAQADCGGCKGLCGGKGKQTWSEGTWGNTPLFVQVLGICSALAVTTRLENAVVMGLALIFTTAGSSLFVSLLRKVTPPRIRLIVELTIISVFVITLDLLLKAFYWDMSKQLGPYVGLIITNCIVLGRAEAFALQNPPILSIVDGAANGAGYAAVLVVMGFIRELLGAGRILGHQVLSASWYTPNQFMVLAPGAFILMGALLMLYNVMRMRQASAAGGETQG